MHLLSLIFVTQQKLTADSVCRVTSRDGISSYQSRTTQWLQRLLVTALISLALPGHAIDRLAPQPQSAASQTVTFNIPRQTADDALLVFGQQANVTVIYPFNRVKDHKTNTLQGVYSVPRAVAVLLANTGLEGNFSAEGHLLITQVDQTKGKSMNTSKRKNVLATMVGLFATAGGVGSALWQGDEAATAQGRIDEIIVTATKRESSMQDLPMSINAFDSDRLEASSVEDIKDLQFLAAGLHVGGNRNYTAVTVRGIGGDLALPGTSSGVAVHLDGIYLGQRTQLGRAFFDIDRIEVLRGPQGTLYGRNATGGSVNIISKKPSELLEGGLAVSFGNYNLIDTEGHLSGPIINDQIEAKIAFKTVSRDGYTNNINSDKEVDDDNSKSIRSHISYKAIESLKLDFIADYTKDKSVPIPVTSRGIETVPTIGEAFGGTLATGRQRNVDFEDRQDVEAWGLNVKAVWELDNTIFTSITGYRETDLFQQYDADSTDADVIYVSSSIKSSHQISQEFNLTSDGDDNLEWILGAYYFKEDDFYEEDAPISPLGIALTFGVSDLISTAYAAYAELDYRISDTLSISSGMRYSYEEKEIDEFTGIIGAISTDSLKDDWKSFTPKLSLIYKLSENKSLYATVGRGFKAGGFNGGVLQGESFDPEKVTNTEFGIKTILYDGRLMANLSIFNMDYKDLQVQIPKLHPITGVALVAVDNAAKAVTRGIEVDIQASINDGFTLDANLAYLDATFKEYATVDEVRGGALFELSGNNLPAAPDWAFNLGAERKFNLKGWAGTLRAEYIYQGETYFSPFEDEPLSAALRGQESYKLFNAYITLVDGTQNWKISVFGKNITDEVISEYANIQPAFLGFIKRDFLMPPRTYGLSFGYTF